MNDSLDSLLSSALDDVQLLRHPFYRRWEAGGLSQSELREYAEQYRFFEAMLPKFLEALSSQLLEGFARDSVLNNLADEVGSPSHLELFEKFASFYGATRAPISPAMARLVANYGELLEESAPASMAGLWAYESQGAGIADSKAEGLRHHYGASDEALEFWLAHGSIEADHAQWTFDALAQLDPDDGVVSDAARRVGDAWWSFLDERELVAS